MPTTANIKAVITAEDKASAVIKGFGTNVDDTSKNITGGLNASVLAVGAATAGIVAFGKKSFDAFNTQDLAVHRLQAGINNVKSATDKHIGSLIAQAAALQKTTRFSDDAYISAQGILTTFQLNQKAIEKLTPRLADMSEGLARVTGEMPDLEGNAILVAKAIGGEDVAGLTGALRRVGVIMTKTQQELLQTGTVEQRVALVTQILDQNFKGLAASAGDTTAGKVAQLKNQFNDLQEKVGQLLATALTPLLNVLNAHPLVLTVVTGAVGALAVAFVGLKVAAAIGPVFQLASGAMAFAGTTAVATTGAIQGLTAATILAAAPFAALAVAATAASVGIIIAAQNARDALNNTQNAIDSYKKSASSVHSSLQAGLLSNDPAVRARSQKALNAGFATGGFTGTGNATDIAGVVHKGEYVVPKEQVNQNTGRPNMGGGVVNIAVNVGVYAGTQMELRKLATKVMGAYQDAQGMKA